MVQEWITKLVCSLCVEDDRFLQGGRSFLFYLLVAQFPESLELR